MSKRAASAAMIAVGFLLVHSAARGDERRPMRHIERPQVHRDVGPLYEGKPVPLPSREACEQSVRKVAAAYRPGGTLGSWLAADFPNREELLDALERAAPHATRVTLEVESIESAKIEPWRVDVRKSKPGEQHIVVNCVADVRTRLSYDDPASGQRVVRDVGRAQWVLRYEQVVAP